MADPVEIQINSLLKPGGTPHMKLDGAIDDTQTIITVDALPANVTAAGFRIHVVSDTSNEYMRVTDISAAPDLEVVREAEEAVDLPAVIHPDEASVFIVPTAGGIERWLAENFGGGAGGGVIGVAVFSAAGGTISGATYAGIISSVTRNGAGDYTCHLSPTQTAPYAVSISCSSDLSDVMTTYINATALGASSFDFSTVRLPGGSGGVAADRDVVTVVITGTSPISGSVEEALASGDTTLTPANTWVDVAGCSLTLDAGTYRLEAQIDFDHTGTAARGNFAAKIYAGGTTYVDADGVQSNDGVSTMYIFRGKVVLVALTTVKLAARAQQDNTHVRQNSIVTTVGPSTLLSATRL